MVVLLHITASTLLIHGGKKTHVQYEALAEVAAAIPTRALVTIEAGHRIHSTRPAGFQSAIEKFLHL